MAICLTVSIIFTPQSSVTILLSHLFDIASISGHLLLIRYGKTGEGGANLQKTKALQHR